MGFTLTIHGTLGQTTSDFAREVITQLSTASAECVANFAEKFLIRKNALDIPAIPDTVLPITITLPFPNVSFLAIRTVNKAQVSLNYLKPGSPATHQIIPLSLGDSSHPEGLLVIFGGPPNLTLSIDSVETDETEISIWAAGN